MVTTPDLEKMVRDLLEVFGERPNRPGLKGTPLRYLRALEELLQGYIAPMPEFTVFDSQYDQMVVVSHIECISLCEHHILPILIDASVGYVPDEKIVGISKIPRLVKWCCARLVVQEDLTGQIADILSKELKPLGVMVVLKGRHLCMEMRGVRTRAPVTTSAIRGIFKEPERFGFTGIHPVQEFLEHCRQGEHDGIRAVELSYGENDNRSSGR